MSADKAIKQDSLPFPPTPSASIAGRTMQESVYKRRVEPRRLPAGSPNILTFRRVAIAVSRFWQQHVRKWGLCSRAGC